MATQTDTSSGKAEQKFSNILAVGSALSTGGGVLYLIKASESWTGGAVMLGASNMATAMFTLAIALLVSAIYIRMALSS